MKKRRRRSFTAEFKREAVRLCEVGDRISQVAKDLALGETALRAWVKRAAASGRGPEPAGEFSAYANRLLIIRRCRSAALTPDLRRYGGPKFQLTQQVMTRFAEAIEHVGVGVVPRIPIGGGGNGTPGGGGIQGNFLEALLALMLSDRLGDQVVSDKPADPTLISMRDRLRSRVMATATRSPGDQKPT